MKCFVVMPIGDQKYDNLNISSFELKKKYNDLIKESLLSVNKDLEIIRADEVVKTGSITNEIFKNIIYSDYVIVDITYPNPNVFYELGLRHATRNKTVLIKEKNSQLVPFDISNFRYIEYENTASGLKTLKKEFTQIFKSFENEPNHIDNDFLKILRSIQLIINNKKEAKKKTFKAIFENQEMIQEIISGDEDKVIELLLKSKNLDDIIDGFIDLEEI